MAKENIEEFYNRSSLVRVIHNYMTIEQIDELFQQTIQIKGIEKKAGVSKQVIYNYRNRPTLSMGDKINFLFKLDLLEVSEKKHVTSLNNNAVHEHVKNQIDIANRAEEVILKNSK